MYVQVFKSEQNEETALTLFSGDYEQVVTTIITLTAYTTTMLTESGFTDTNPVGVIPTATSIPTLSVTTTIDDSNSDLTLVNVLLPTGAGTTVEVSSIKSPHASIF